jgi:uncharacterized OB-fold protein
MTDDTTSAGPNILGERLLPVPEPDNQPFWDALRAGELRIQRCVDCDTLQHPPQPICPRCPDSPQEWALMSGRGEVYSYVVTHQPTNPAFRDKTPFATVIVELAEGPRLVSNLVDVAPDAIEIGMPVEVVFHPVTEEITLPLFRRATSP